MAAAHLAALRPNGEGGRKWLMISLTVRLIIFAKVEVAELGVAWVSEQVVLLVSGLQLVLESELLVLA
jgi:predicted nucleotidyltransferase